MNSIQAERMAKLPIMEEYNMTSYGSVRDDVVVWIDQSKPVEDRQKGVSDHEEEEIIQFFWRETETCS